MKNYTGSQEHSTTDNKKISVSCHIQFLQSRIDVLEYLWKIRRQKHKFPSHEHISKKTGWCISTVQTALKEFRKLNILDWKYWHRHSNWYTLLPEFYKLPLFAKRIANFISIALLTTMGLHSEQNELYRPLVSSSLFKVNSVISTQVKEGENYELLREIEQKEREMERKNESVLSKDICKAIGGTNLACIELEKYHDAALEYAKTRLSTALRMDNPVKYIFAVCNQYSKDNYLAIDWDYTRKLRTSRGYSQEDERYIDTDILTQLRSQSKEAIRGKSIPVNNQKSISRKEREWNGEGCRSMTDEQVVERNIAIANHTFEGEDAIARAARELQDIFLGKKIFSG